MDHVLTPEDYVAVIENNQEILEADAFLFNEGIDNFVNYWI